MTTKLIGLKEFRQNLSHYTKVANAGNIRFIILKKNIPILEVKPLDEKNFVIEKLAKEVGEAREQVKSGKVYTQAQIMQEFGLL